MFQGDCFTFRSGSDGFHLWVVVSDPAQNSNDVLVVNLTTVRGGRFEDLSCVFEAGEHEWLSTKSFVAFRYARVYSLSHLVRLIHSKVLRAYDPFPIPLLQRIFAGASFSPYLEMGYLELLRDQGFVAREESGESPASPGH